MTGLKFFVMEIGKADSEEIVREILEIPHGIRPAAIVPAGYPAESLSPRNRKRGSQLVHHEKSKGLKD